MVGLFSACCNMHAGGVSKKTALPAAVCCHAQDDHEGWPAKAHLSTPRLPNPGLNHPRRHPPVLVLTRARLRAALAGYSMAAYRSHRSSTTTSRSRMHEELDASIARQKRSDCGEAGGGATTGVMAVQESDSGRQPRAGRQWQEQVRSLPDQRGRYGATWQGVAAKQTAHVPTSATPTSRLRLFHCGSSAEKMRPCSRGM